ncbi:MAG: four helix bundle protein [Chloroflexi bacterium]|nr:four helix bundle protein [Chloroflexota bacterium]
MAEQVTGRGFEDLKAWQLARQLMIGCHQVADSLPAKERYDLAPQMRRSSKSVMANIAEGYGRYHYLDRLRFLYIARGSLNETINHVITAHDLAYLADVRYKELYQLGREAERTLNGYINHVHRQRTGSDTYGDKYIPTPDEIPTPLEK